MQYHQFKNKYKCSHVAIHLSSAIHFVLLAPKQEKCQEYSHAPSLFVKAGRNVFAARHCVRTTVRQTRPDTNDAVTYRTPESFIVAGPERRRMR